MSKSKLTIDLTDENRIKLEQRKKENGMPYGATINALVRSFSYVPQNVKRKIAAFISSEVKKLYIQMDGASEFNAHELSAELEAYSLMKEFFCDRELSVDRNDSESNLKKTLIKNGIFICPSSYIMINREAALDSLYACIIECRNSESFGAKYLGETIPHFVYFCNTKYADSYDDAFYELVNRECVLTWPKFKKVLECQVEPIDDPDDPGGILNAEAWFEAPTIGYYAVYEQGDNRFALGYKPPAGVRIVRMLGG